MMMWSLVVHSIASLVMLLFNALLFSLSSRGRKYIPFLAIGFQALNTLFWSSRLFLGHTSETFFLNVWLYDLKLSVGVDKISGILALLVALISLFTYLFSFYYIETKEKPSFFSLMLLFSVSMQWLLCAQDFVLAFFCWELIGVTSFLLIGFSHQALALKNAQIVFLVNRVGDIAFFYGLLALFSKIESLSFTTVLPYFLSDIQLLYPFLVAILIKSAQWPFHLWLPRSMSAPTPVSALLHAATLVTAGMYFYMKMSHINSDLFAHSHLGAMLEFLGAVTILFGAFVAIFQSNIKSLVAYSTISQLGYVGTALGLGLNDLALYHLWTHGFFKALLFLIVGLAYQIRHSLQLDDLKGVFAQNISMKAILMVGLLSLIGCPFFGGFYSKERIIHWALFHQVSFFTQSAMIIGAIFTAIYAGKLASILIQEDAETLHEETIKKSSAQEHLMMQYILGFLAIATLIAGPLGELPMMNLIALDEKKGIAVLWEALSTGWVLVFLTIFLVSFRLNQKISELYRHSNYCFRYKIIFDEEFFIPQKIFSFCSDLYLGLSKFIHSLQEYIFENGLGFILLGSLKSLHISCQDSMRMPHTLEQLRYALIMGIIISLFLRYILC